MLPVPSLLQRNAPALARRNSYPAPRHDPSPAAHAAREAFARAAGHAAATWFSGGAARRTIRRHAMRSVVRVTGLLVADFLAIQSLRWLLTESPIASPAVAAWWRSTPPGAVPFPQFAPAVMLGMLLMGGYGAGRDWRSTRVIGAASTLAVLLLGWSRVWAAPVAALPEWALVVAQVTAAILLFRRLSAAAVLACYPFTRQRLVVVGRPDHLQQTWFDTPAVRAQGIDVVERVSADATTAPATLCDALEDAIRRGEANGILIAGRLPDDQLAAIVRTGTLTEQRIYKHADAYVTAGCAPRFEKIGGEPCFEIRPIGFRAPQLVAKRLTDLLGSSVLLVLLSPLYLALAIAVRLASPGPIFFGQVRLGRHGVPFRCYKFRSMCIDAEARLKADPALHAAYIANDFKLPPDVDPRITPIGRWMRRTSLDELPQIWNVFLGQMSMVGPRPIVPDELAHYHIEAPRLLLAKPGMTGLWQVSGRSDVGYPERADLELSYVENWSFVGDLALVWRTIRVVLTGRGAH